MGVALLTQASGRWLHLSTLPEHLFMPLYSARYRLGATAAA